ncbi:SusC/RagA family TonB-linked outer membrane protein [Mucilaginibacter flavidus]|uniref:SusC/RagA family TonB-linked outer membrane protein n=1 Tax=Mucilaginibacter flavidus TaxID=2949309 RepID=UPI00209229E8|nr:TonB-dependent receptor [Mucilaginibacter flavidus]MCO5949263.1 TonB-dependent receptor [Mucilaginibacter flavidus]
MNFNSKAKLLLWLYLPKILSPIPLTALIIITVLTQANAGTNTRHPFSGAKKTHESGPTFLAEVIKIEGKVTDEKGATLPGVSVKIKGSANGTITNSDGKYTITVPNEQTILVFSYIGFNSQEQKVGNSTVINIVLTGKSSTLNEVVVVAYGTQKKGSVIGAVSTLKGEEVLQNASPSVSNSLAGHIPGLIINNRSGEPGNDGASLLIRGLNSFGGGTGPLIVVDGIPDRDLNRINPDDIESVTVLKDASAAIYGVRSANGAILITTKRGKSGKPVIHYDGSYGLQQITRLTQRVNAWEYMTYFNELNLNQGNSAPYPQSDIDKYKAGNDPNYTSTDWVNAVFRKNAPQNNHSLSVQGGGEQVKYYFSVQSLDQQSNLRNSDERFKEFNIRSNIDATISQNLKVNLDIAARKEDRNSPVISMSQILHEAVSMYPFLPVYWQNGYADAGVSNGRNPVIMTSPAAGYDKTSNYILNPKLGFDLKLPYITPGLSVNGYAAFDYNYRAEKTFNQPWDAYTYDMTTKTYNNQRSGTSILSLAQDGRLTNENTYFIKLAYDQQFGKHTINAFAGFEQNTTNWNDTYAYRRDLLSNQLDQLFTGSAVGQNATGSAYQDGRESYLGRVAYSYANKYLAEATFRYNGSFNFPADKRWGLFPAVSLGWRISEEDFFKNNFKGIDQLKLRASWGLMGNDAVAQYLYVTRYQLQQSPEYYSYFGDGYTEAKNLYLSATPNPNITWEKQDTRNIGFDAAFLSNRLTVSFDAFRFLRKDILAQRNASVPLYTGLSLPAENIGKSLNRGIDFSINYNETKGTVKYHIGGNFTYAKSKIIFRDESPNIPAWQKSTGYAIDSWLVYQTKGIYHTQAEVDNSPHMPGVKPGDLWIVDKSANGQITSDDMVRIPESATPKIMYGVLMGAEYKGIALNLVWSGQAMAKQMILPQLEGSLAAPPAWLYNGRWTPQNPNSQYPRAFNYTDPRNSVYADFWLRDASFMRLKTAELSYTLPANTFEKYGIGSVKVFFGATNLFSIDGLKKYNVDPETNSITGVNYPQSRIFRLGLNVNL